MTHNYKLYLLKLKLIVNRIVVENPDLIFANFFFNSYWIHYAVKALRHKNKLRRHFKEL